MSGKLSWAVIGLAATTVLSGCEIPENPLSSFADQISGQKQTVEAPAEVLDVQSLLKPSTTERVNTALGFPKAVAEAVRIDPLARAARQAVLAGASSLDELQAQLKPQISGRGYAGVDDLYDGDPGAAATLNLAQLIFDGGVLAGRISAAEFDKQSAYESYRRVLNERALEATIAWIDLNRYQQLHTLITSRLEVLNPLIEQLEQVASAGIGDVTTVASAKRQVTMIRVSETRVQEQYQQAREKFTRLFGELPKSSSYNAGLILRAVPSSMPDSAVMNSPAVMQAYNRYHAADARARSIEARGSFSMSLEGAVTQPGDGNEADRSASVGLVLRKDLYDGGALEAQIEAARSDADAQKNQLEGAYRQVLEQAQNARQTITATKASVILARENAEIAREEIELLRKQLSIGQSTLSSVLQAEARLYDAEANEINFSTSRIIAQVTLLGVLGRLSDVIGLDAAKEVLGQAGE